MSLLTQVFKSVFSRSQGTSLDTQTPVILPKQSIAQLDVLHERAGTEDHINILFGDIRIGDQDFLDMYRDSAGLTRTRIGPWKTMRRVQAAYNLVRYFLYSLDIKGSRVECGVFRGFSLLLLCKAASAAHGEYSGAGLHGVDSFAGFPEPTVEDHILEMNDDKITMTPAFGEGSGKSSHEFVAGVLEDYGDLVLHKGFIPEVFKSLPDTRWSFVHIDVDLHDATAEALDYFWPRLVKGGVIICDDYGAIQFPGAKLAWDRFCDEQDIPFVILDTGQAVILNPY